MTTTITPQEILAIPMGDNDAAEATIGGYLTALVQQVWTDGEEFSGKRPFGNSGWKWELYGALVDAGALPGTRDEWGEPDCNTAAADKLIQDAILHLGDTGPAASDTPAETEWGVRDEDDTVIPGTLAQSQRRAARYGFPLVSRTVGPWQATSTPAASPITQAVGATRLTWTVWQVKPGTPYEEIPPGTYVFGNNPDDDPENGPAVTLRVVAVHGGTDDDTAGTDRSLPAALALAGILRGDGGPVPTGEVRFVDARDGAE